MDSNDKDRAVFWIKQRESMRLSLRDIDKEIKRLMKIRKAYARSIKNLPSYGLRDGKGHFVKLSRGLI